MFRLIKYSISLWDQLKLLHCDFLCCFPASFSIFFFFCQCYHNIKECKFCIENFADDIALLSEQIKQAQVLLTNVETSAAQIGLEMNAKKTMAFNQSD
jgi:hypothetical protein